MYDDVRRVGIRQFQQNFHKELKELPFIVTKDGNDYCVVTPLTAINDIVKMLRSDDVTTPVTTEKNMPMVHSGWAVDPEEQLDDKPTDRCQAPNANCKNIGYLYRVTFMSDEGEKKKEIFLCGVHIKKAKESGMEVTEV